MASNFGQGLEALLTGAFDTLYEKKKSQEESNQKIREVQSEAQSRAQAQYQYDPEAQFKSAIYQKLLQDPSLMSHPVVRKLLGGDKTPEQLKAEKKAEREGEIEAGALPEGPGKQITDIKTAKDLLDRGSSVISRFFTGEQPLDPATREFLLRKLQEVQGGNIPTSSTGTPQPSPLQGRFKVRLKGS